MSGDNTRIKLRVHKNDIEYGVVKIIDEVIMLREIINSSCACTEQETINRLKQMNRLEILEDILYTKFNIQSHQYNSNTVIEII